MTELPSSAYGVVKLLPETKDQVNIFSNQLIQAVKRGEINPLELKAYFKAMEKVVEIVDRQTRTNQLSEADKYSEKEFEAFGFKISKEELATKYDYLSCGDYEYERLHAELETAKARLKDRETFLKAIKEPTTIVYESTGEVITVKPPVKTSTSGLKFTMK